MPLLPKVSRRLRDAHTRLHTASRKRLARALYSLPPLQRHDPRRKLVTFKQHCRQAAQFPDTATASPADWYLALHAPEKLHRRPSLSLDDAQAAQFRTACEHYQGGEHFEIPEIFLASLARPKVFADRLITVSRDNHILLESALSQPDVLEQHGILDTVFHPRCATLPGNHCLLGTPWSAGYYHWLLEALPRLEIIERFPTLADARLIVTQPLNRFQRETLDLAGVPATRIIGLPSAVTQIERLFFPQIPAPTGNPSPRAVAWLRSRLLPRAGAAAPRATRKLYITRRDAPQRRLLNEEEIIRVVQQRGFEVVALGDVSVADQIRLFSETRAVIAPHGAGVTNVLFSPPGATIVEFFGTNYINGCYWALANLCGHRHAFLTGEPTGLDYRIPAAQLERLLAQLGEN